jgi:hypothetical protein
MRLGGPQDRTGRVRKISPPPGNYSLAVRLVASRYPDPRYLYGALQMEPFTAELNTKFVKLVFQDFD